ASERHIATDREEVENRDRASPAPGSCRETEIALPVCDRSWLPCKNVRSSALVLHFRSIRPSLDDLFGGKPRRFYITPDFWWLKEEEIHRNRPPPQLIFVKDFVAGVKRQQQHPARLQYSRHFPKHQG